MNREQLLSEVQGIFRDIFGDNSLTIENSTSADNIEAWDSLNHIN